MGTPNYPNEFWCTARFEDPRPQEHLSSPWESQQRAHLSLSPSLPSRCRCLWTWTRWTRYNPWLAHSSPLAPGRVSGNPERCWASHGTGWCWHTSVGKWWSRSRRWWHTEELRQEKEKRQHMSGPSTRAQECPTCPEQAGGQSCPLQDRLSWLLQKNLTQQPLGVDSVKEAWQQATRTNRGLAGLGWTGVGMTGAGAKRQREGGAGAVRLLYTSWHKKVWAMPEATSQMCYSVPAQFLT